MRQRIPNKHSKVVIEEEEEDKKKKDIDGVYEKKRDGIMLR